MGLFPASLSHQDTRGQPGARHYIDRFLPHRESSRIPPSIISCATGYPNLSRHDAGEDEYRPASYSSRLSVSLRPGFAYGDASPSPPFARAVIDWDPARLHGYIVVAHRAASACVFQRIGRWSGARVPLLKRLQSGLGARSKRTEGIRGQRKTSDYLSVLLRNCAAFLLPHSLPRCRQQRHPRTAAA